jgi:pimeloyl-ACP methyl ester carboxylesterase
VARRRRSVIKRSALALSVPLAGALASAAYQALGERRDRARHPAPGRLVNVGGRRLHLLATTGSGPPVVIITGAGVPCLEWVPVQRALAPEVPVILYDRPGLGWSDPAPGPRTAGRLAAELHELLSAAAAAPPYLLAGHSLGGLVALTYASRHPGELAAVALIDSSHPGMLGVRPLGRRSGVLLQAAQARARPLGLRRLASDLGLSRGADREASPIYPPDLAVAGRALMLSSRRRQAGVSEILALPRSCAEASQHLHHLGTLPLAVISAGHDGSAEPGTRAAIKAQRWHQAWSELQRNLANLSDDSTHVIAERAGHLIHRDDPDLVAAVLRDLAQRVRG